MSTNGPGRLAHAGHADLGTRLAALCLHARVNFARKHTLGLSPFGGPHRCDVFIRDLPAYPRGLAVVGRWQEGPGSADQKLAFLLECIAATGVPTFIVLDGAGWRQPHWDYLARHVGGPFVGALTVEAFAALLRAAGSGTVVRQQVTAD
jgi:hypothetical protein